MLVNNLATFVANGGYHNDEKVKGIDWKLGTTVGVVRDDVLPLLYRQQLGSYSTTIWPPLIHFHRRV